MAKWLSEEVLQITEEGREMKGKGERERYTQMNSKFIESKRDKKPFLNEQYKEKEENDRMGKTRNFLKKKKTGDIKKTFHARIGMIKHRKDKELTEAEEIKKSWPEYIELYKKGLNDSDNHSSVLIHLEPDILEREVKWA